MTLLAQLAMPWLILRHRGYGFADDPDKLATWRSVFAAHSVPVSALHVADRADQPAC